MTHLNHSLLVRMVSPPHENQLPIRVLDAEVRHGTASAVDAGSHQRLFVLDQAAAVLGQDRAPEDSGVGGADDERYPHDNAARLFGFPN